MDASRIITFTVWLAALVALSAAVTTEAEFSSSVTTEVTKETSTIITTTVRPPPRNCTNARGNAGVCTMRQDCDHSSGPVDLSLYAPSWYKSSCEENELCCPFFALVPKQPPRNGQEDDNNSFGDD